MSEYKPLFFNVQDNAEQERRYRLATVSSTAPASSHANTEATFAPQLQSSHTSPSVDGRQESTGIHYLPNGQITYGEPRNSSQRMAGTASPADHSSTESVPQPQLFQPSDVSNASLSLEQPNIVSPQGNTLYSTAASVYSDDCLLTQPIAQPINSSHRTTEMASPANLYSPHFAAPYSQLFQPSLISNAPLSPEIVSPQPMNSASTAASIHSCTYWPTQPTAQPINSSHQTNETASSANLNSTHFAAPHSQLFQPSLVSNAPLSAEIVSPQPMNSASTAASIHSCTYWPTQPTAQPIYSLQQPTNISSLANPSSTHIDTLIPQPQPSQPLQPYYNSDAPSISQWSLSPGQIEFFPQQAISRDSAATVGVCDQPSQQAIEGGNDTERCGTIENRQESGSLLLSIPISKKIRFMGSEHPSLLAFRMQILPNFEHWLRRWNIYQEAMDIDDFVMHLTNFTYTGSPNHQHPRQIQEPGTSAQRDGQALLNDIRDMVKDCINTEPWILGNRVTYLGSEVFHRSELYHVAGLLEGRQFLLRNSSNPPLLKVLKQKVP